MAWRRPGDNPLSELMMVSLPTHICVTRPQWVKMTSLETHVVSNHRQFECLFNRLLRLLTQKHQNTTALSLCDGNPSNTCRLHSQTVSDAESISMSWRSRDGWHISLAKLIVNYSIHVPGWLLKWLNLIIASGSVSNEPGSVTWLATKYLKNVSWRNHTKKLTILWPPNISFWPKINIPSSYFIISMLNFLENTFKLQFDSYVTAVKFLT